MKLYKHSNHFCFLKDTFKYLADKLFKQWTHFHILINEKDHKENNYYCVGEKTSKNFHEQKFKDKIY